MPSPPKRINEHLTYLDPFLLDRARINLGWSRGQLGKKTRIRLNTLADAFGGQGLQAGTAERICHHLGHEVLEMLAPWDPRYKVPAEPPGPWSGAGEWECKDYLNQRRLAPNGLYYIVCRMQHRHTAGKLARGKFYHLSWLPVDKREGMRHQLSRHADVCARVGVHPNIAVNHASTPATGDEGWWVIDDWVGEKTLADCLPWPKETLPRLLLEIARGLEALHKAGVVFRELAPIRVLVSDRDGRVVLTDFELAKLLDGARSVSGDEWPEDRFRADEIGNGTATLQADLFSLAMTAAAAISGSQFDRGRVVEILEAAELPRRLCRLLVQSSHPVPDERPAELAPLLKELTRWAEK